MITRLKNSVGSRIETAYNNFKYGKHSHPKTFDWQWNDKGYNRIALVNYLISQRGGLECNYLEIGCDLNHLFDSVFASKKTGVDPANGGTHRMTSDDFFKQNSEMFDVIFIDGLHEYLQVRRDAINALEALADGGWIAFHDFLPSSWREHHVPRISNSWTGDVWKLAVELFQAEGVEFHIINIDHGVGLLRKKAQNFTIPDLSEQLLSAEFDKFVDEVDNFSIIEFSAAISKIQAAG